MDKKRVYFNVGVFFTITLVMLAIGFGIIYADGIKSSDKPSAGIIDEKKSSINSEVINENSATSASEDKKDNSIGKLSIKEMGFFLNFVGGPVTGSVMKNIYYNDGYVGIGTDNPKATLDVQGNAIINGNLNVSGEIISNEESEGVKVYRAFIGQQGTNAPVANVLENTIGPANWTRLSVGYYALVLSEAFPTAKTVGFATPGESPIFLVSAIPMDDAFELEIYQMDSLGDTFSLKDNWVANVEIYVYP